MTKDIIEQKFIEFQRLYKAVISIDFDGVIAECAYPELGCIREGAIEYINKLYNEGYGIVINTCRSGDHQKLVEQFLKDNNINYHHINENFEYLIGGYGGDSRKISADIYIDDKDLFWNNPSWETKYNKIIEKFKNK